MTVADLRRGIAALKARRQHAIVLCRLEELQRECHDLARQLVALGEASAPAQAVDYDALARALESAYTVRRALGWCAQMGREEGPRREAVREIVRSADRELAAALATMGATRYDLWQAFDETGGL